MIITIGRQFGSGGKEIGQKLAQRLGVSCYDKEIIQAAAKQSGMNEKLFETYGEKPTNSLLYSLVAGSYVAGGNTPIGMQVNLAQFDAIKQIAQQGPCVLVGRCADYILREKEDLLSVFIHADMPNRVERIMRLYRLSEDKARETILKTDKSRASYYSYYTDRTWSDARNYHLCIDSGKIGVDGAIDLICRTAELTEK